MERIPVNFDFNGKQYSGYLSQVTGTGETGMFHLSIDNYYYGQLRYSSFINGWVFDTNKGSEGWEKLAEYFGYVVTAWYDSH